MLIKEHTSKPWEHTPTAPATAPAGFEQPRGNAAAQDAMAQEQGADMDCQIVEDRRGRDRMICSETEILETPEERADREAVARLPRDYDDVFGPPMDLPDPPAARERRPRHESGTRVLDGAIETDDSSIHAWASGVEEFDDDAGRVGVMTGDGHAGIYEMPNGERRMGADGRIEGFGGEVEDRDGNGMDIQGLGGTGGLYLGEDGAAAGGTLPVTVTV